MADSVVVAAVSVWVVSFAGAVSDADSSARAGVAVMISAPADAATVAAARMFFGAFGFSVSFRCFGSALLLMISPF